jgi:hypothetical protein
VRRNDILVIPWFSAQQYAEARRQLAEELLPAEFDEWHRDAKAAEANAMAERRAVQRVSIDPQELRAFARSRGWERIDSQHLFEFARTIARTEASAGRRVDLVGLRDRPARKPPARRARTRH